MIRQLMMVLLLLTAGYIAAEDVTDKDNVTKNTCCKETVTENSQSICPVMGEKINSEIYVDYEGKRIYFCCQGCVDTFKADPAPYMKKIQDSGVVLAKTPCCDNKNCSGCKKHGEKTSAVEKHSTCCDKN